MEQRASCRRAAASTATISSRSSGSGASEETYHIYIGDSGGRWRGMHPSLTNFQIGYNRISDSVRRRGIYTKRGGTIEFNHVQGRGPGVTGIRTSRRSSLSGNRCDNIDSVIINGPGPPGPRQLGPRAQRSAPGVRVCQRRRRPFQRRPPRQGARLGPARWITRSAAPGSPAGRPRPRACPSGCGGCAGSAWRRPDLWRVERWTESNATSNTRAWRHLAHRAVASGGVVADPAVELQQLGVGVAGIGLADRDQLRPGRAVAPGAEGEVGVEAGALAVAALGVHQHHVEQLARRASTSTTSPSAGRRDRGCPCA